MVCVLLLEKPKFCLHIITFKYKSLCHLTAANRMKILQILVIRKMLEITIYRIANVVTYVYIKIEYTS